MMCLMKQINQKPDYIYRSPNTKQELPFQTLERLVREIDEVKKKYAAKDIDDNELKRFGDSFLVSFNLPLCLLTIQVFPQAI